MKPVLGTRWKHCRLAPIHSFDIGSRPIILICTKAHSYPFRSIKHGSLTESCINKGNLITYVRACMKTANLFHINFCTQADMRFQSCSQTISRIPDRDGIQDPWTKCCSPYLQILCQMFNPAANQEHSFTQHTKPVQSVRRMEHDNHSLEGMYGNSSLWWHHGITRSTIFEPLRSKRSDQKERNPCGARTIRSDQKEYNPCGAETRRFGPKGMQSSWRLDLQVRIKRNAILELPMWAISTIVSCKQGFTRRVKIFSCQPLSANPWTSARLQDLMCVLSRAACCQSLPANPRCSRPVGTKKKSDTVEWWVLI